jgi:MFS family permease
MKNTINPSRLFIASCIALIATAMTFAIRANLIGTLGNEFNISPGDMGIVFGTAFWGFTLSMVAGGSLCDFLGMRKLIILAFTGHLAGILLTIFATGFWTLFISTLFVGIANGLIEAACNPLIASLYPGEKTKRLNLFHVWFPGGIVIGGLIAFFLNETHASWQWQIASILIPTIAYGFLFFNQKFPVTERVSSGVSTVEMMKECGRPLFLFMVFCMLLTAATELGTNQWVAELLENVGVSSILLLVFINGLMTLGRSFAGEMEHRLSPSGMLLFSAFGLYLLSQASAYWSFAAAAIFAIGICFFWPTMLGYVSEYISRNGALGLAIMGGAGMLSVSIILPFIGDLYEGQTQLHLPEGTTLASLKDAGEGTDATKILKSARLAGGASTLLYVSFLPAFLTIAFGMLYIFRQKLQEIKNPVS